MPKVSSMEASRQAWKEALREKAAVVREVSQTESGQKLLELLSDTFEKRSLVGEEPHETYYRLGQRDVVQYLRELQEVNNERI